MGQILAFLAHLSQPKLQTCDLLRFHPVRVAGLRCYPG